MTTSRMTLRPFALLTLAGALVSCAFAEPPAPKSDPLSGPSVTDKVAPGSHGTFGGGAEKSDKKRGEQEIPHPAFMKAVQEAIGDAAPADVRATPELQDKIRAVSDEFSQAQRKFAQENRGELAKMRGAGGKGKGQPGAEGGKPGGGEPDAEREAMLEKARELRERAPKAADAHTKIWAMLSELQQKAVQVRLDAFKEEMRAKQNERYVESRAGKKAPQGQPDAKPGEKPVPPAAAEPKKPGKRPAAKGGEEGGRKPAAEGQRPEAARAPISGEHRERIMRLLERLTPEQREEMIKRIEERMNSGAGAPNLPNRPGREVKNPQGEAKPAPRGRDVDIPPAAPTPPAAPKQPD